MWSQCLGGVQVTLEAFLWLSIIYCWLLIKALQPVSMVKCSIRYSMIGSADVTIYSNLHAQPMMFNPIKFLSGWSGGVDLYPLWRSKMHSVGDVWNIRLTRNSCSKSSFFLDACYSVSFSERRKSESLHLNTCCYCHIWLWILAYQHVPSTEVQPYSTCVFLQPCFRRPSGPHCHKRLRISMELSAPKLLLFRDGI